MLSVGGCRVQIAVEDSSQLRLVSRNCCLAALYLDQEGIVSVSKLVASFGEGVNHTDQVRDQLPLVCQISAQAVENPPPKLGPESTPGRAHWWWMKSREG